MSHSENKFKWCIKKAEKELQHGSKHRGLIKIKPNLKLIESHIRKSGHNLNAIIDFRDIGYSDWSASAAFYCIYHCLLAITTKFGYESRNQECTFALIYYLIETEKISLDKELVQEIHLLNPEDKHESATLIEIREIEQYGVRLSLEDEAFNKMLKIAKIILNQTKKIIEE